MSELEHVQLKTDELEALRLCDLLELTQEEAGRRMGVSRGTIQRIVCKGRKKIIRALIEGCALVLETETKEKQL